MYVCTTINTVEYHVFLLILHYNHKYSGIPRVPPHIALSLGNVILYTFIQHSGRHLTHQKSTKLPMAAARTVNFTTFPNI